MKAIELLRINSVSYNSIDNLLLENENWARIQVKSVGLCGSDIQKYNMRYKLIKNKILGHEFTGKVSEIKKNNYGLKKGMRITAIPLIYCEQCEYCLKGNFNLCKNLKTLGGDLPGAFAEQILVPIKNIRKLPNKIEYKIGTLIDPIAVAIHTHNKISENHQGKVLIIGDGTLALCCLNIFKKNNIVDVIGKHKFNLSFCSFLGARKVFRINKIESIPKNSYDIIIECVGKSQSYSINQCVRFIKPFGCILIVGVFKKNYVGSLNYRKLFYKEVSLFGINSYSIFNNCNEFDLAIAELMNNYDSYKKIITHEFPLSQFNMALKYIKEREKHNIIKIVFYPD